MFFVHCFKKFHSCIKSFIIFSKSGTLDLDKNITTQLLHDKCYILSANDNILNDDLNVFFNIRNR